MYAFTIGIDSQSGRNRFWDVAIYILVSANLSIVTEQITSWNTLISKSFTANRSQLATCGCVFDLICANTP